SDAPAPFGSIDCNNVADHNSGGARTLSGNLWASCLRDIPALQSAQYRRRSDGREAAARRQTYPFDFYSTSSRDVVLVPSAGVPRIPSRLQHWPPSRLLTDR